jgi:hypothetical protein
MEDKSQDFEEKVRLQIKEVIDREAPAHRKFKFMEETAGGTAMTWRNVYNGNQRASGGYVAMIGRTWPKYGLWLATGLTDEAHGQVSPVLERLREDLQRVGEAG